jgi:hypothetical protein
MFRFLLLSDSPRQPVEFPARACDGVPRLFPLPAIHLQQRFREPLVGTAQDGGGHLQIALYFLRRGRDGRRLPLRFQKQMGLRQDALTRRPRAVAPRGIQLRRLPRAAMLLHKNRSHALALLHASTDSKSRFTATTMGVNRIWNPCRGPSERITSAIIRRVVAEYEFGRDRANCPSSRRYNTL